MSAAAVPEAVASCRGQPAPPLADSPVVGANTDPPEWSRSWVTASGPPSGEVGLELFDQCHGVQGSFLGALHLELPRLLLGGREQAGLHFCQPLLMSAVFCLVDSQDLSQVLEPSGQVGRCLRLR